MARKYTYTASIINIRIVDESLRDYVSLMKDISELKVGVTVRKDTGVAMTYFKPDELRGTLSKYTQIDLDGPWFNERTFDEAADDDTADINVPEHLKPNFSKFAFKVNPEKHLVSFITVAPNGRRLSPLHVKKFFEHIVLRDSITAKFGEIEVTLVQDAASVEKFFNGAPLKVLEIIIRRPNDGLSKTFRKKLGDRLVDNNAKQLTERYVADRGKALTPTKRTKKLAKLATTIGEVKATQEINGVPKKFSSTNFVESESFKFDGEVGDTYALETLAPSLEEKVELVREEPEVVTGEAIEE